MICIGVLLVYVYCDCVYCIDCLAHLCCVIVDLCNYVGLLLFHKYVVLFALRSGWLLFVCVFLLSECD